MLEKTYEKTFFLSIIMSVLVFNDSLQPVYIFFTLYPVEVLSSVQKYQIQGKVDQTSLNLHILQIHRLLLQQKNITKRMVSYCFFFSFDFNVSWYYKCRIDLKYTRGTKQAELILPSLCFNVGVSLSSFFYCWNIHSYDQ